MHIRSIVRWFARPSFVPALGACGLLLTGTASGQAAPPRLAGRWTLNLELSDQIEEKLREAFRLGATRSRALQMAQAGNRKDKPVDDRELMGSLQPPLSIVISQDDSTVAMSDAGGYMVSLYTDGRKNTEYLLSGETLDITAKWKDGILNIERKMERAGSVRETYAIDPAQGKLVVNVKLKTISLPRAIDARRVYDLLAEP
jgi:hypothetical protein